MNRIVGALWRREKDGMEYFSGVLRDLHGDINIAVFPNDYKDKQNQPDMNIVISFGNNQKDSNDSNANRKVPSKSYSKKGKRKKEDKEDSEEDDDKDDVPC